MSANSGPTTCRGSPPRSHHPTKAINHTDEGDRPTDCSGDHAMMANRSDLGWPNPKRPEHRECVTPIGSQPANPIRDSGTTPRTKSGCTGAICSCKPSRTESLANRGRPCTAVRSRLRNGRVRPVSDGYPRISICREAAEVVVAKLDTKGCTAQGLIELVEPLQPCESGSAA